MRKTKYIAESFFRQWKHLSTMLRTGINRCPKDLWSRKRTLSCWSPCHLAYHAAISPAYKTQLEIDEIEFDLNLEIDTPVSKELVKRILDFITNYISVNIANRSDEEILAAKRDDNPLSVKSLMYILRHSQHNVGAFVQILDESGVNSPVWGTGNRQ